MDASLRLIDERKDDAMVGVVLVLCFGFILGRELFLPEFFFYFRRLIQQQATRYVGIVDSTEGIC